MKKFLTIFAVALLVGAAAYAVTVTNRGQVITSQTLNDTITDTADTSVITDVQNGVMIDTNANLVATHYDPEYGIGCVLIGVNATNANVIYMSTGDTTNDWLAID